MTRIFLGKPGVACCAGLSSEELYQNAAMGKRDGIKRVKTESGEDFYAGRIDDEKIRPTTARYDMRICRIQEMALDQIASQVESAVARYGSKRVAVCVGSCDNGTEFSVGGHKVFLSTGKFESRYSLEMQSADYQATLVKEKFGLEGPCLAFSTACSSSAEAIIKGAQLMNAGLADAVVAGGVDITSDTVLLGFGSLEAVSAEITNPFSKNRSGITLGEGAGFFVMTRDEDAASIDCSQVELLGWGNSCDAHHMTSPDPSGDGAYRAMEEALRKADVKPEHVGYVNLHGTGTRLNDSMESLAVSRIFGSHKVAVSTTKPLTGHTLGAGSAIELALCWELIDQGRRNPKAPLPVQVWDGELDPDLPPLNFVGLKNNVPQSPVKICMSNSFAFGGANACLIIGDRT